MEKSIRYIKYREELSWPVSLSLNLIMFRPRMVFLREKDFL